MFRLNAFAKLVGISNVYLSYIESGKRPAPSRPILERMVGVLELSDEEVAQLYSLAIRSRSRAICQSDLQDYINRPYILETLWIAMEKGADERDWIAFQQALNKKPHPDTDSRYK